MTGIPFGTTDWSSIPRTEHPGETGRAFWRTQQFADIRVRMVEYTPGYLADHWCVKGHIHSDGDEHSTLVVSEKAKVEGEIRVSHVVIDGTVNGPVNASEYLELMQNARITGDVTYRTLEMQVGAVIEGRLLHVQPGSADVVELKRLGSDKS